MLSIWYQSPSILSIVLTSPTTCGKNGAAQFATINIDPSQIDQILVNLCINARDVITGNGRITIESSRFSVPEITCEAQ